MSRGRQERLEKLREQQARATGSLLAGEFVPGEQVRGFYMGIASGRGAWSHSVVHALGLGILVVIPLLIWWLDEVPVPQAGEAAFFLTLVLLAGVMILATWAVRRSELGYVVVTDQAIYLVKFGFPGRPTGVRRKIPLGGLAVEPHPDGRADAVFLRWPGGSERLAAAMLRWIPTARLVFGDDAARLASDLRSLPKAAGPATSPPMPSN